MCGKLKQLGLLMCALDKSCMTDDLGRIILVWPIYNDCQFVDQVFVWVTCSWVICISNNLIAWYKDLMYGTSRRGIYFISFTFWGRRNLLYVSGILLIRICIFRTSRIVRFSYIFTLWLRGYLFQTGVFYIDSNFFNGFRKSIFSIENIQHFQKPR